MNRKFLNSRYYQIMVFILILMSALVIRLFVLTVIQHERWLGEGENQNTKEVVISAPRGEILDRYGRVLANNRQIFNVAFNVSGLQTADINLSCYNVVKLLEKNKDEYVNNFPIIINSNGRFKYTFDIDKRKYLASMGLSTAAKPEDVLNLARKNHGIDDKINRYEAFKQLQENYGVWLPINIRSMTYTYDSKKEAFLDKYGLYETKVDKKGKVKKIYNLSAKEAFYKLKENYSLDKPLADGMKVLSDREVRKIFNIREEIKNTGFNKYRSSVIATDVSYQTVAYIEETVGELKGIEIVSDTVRTYPDGKLASHILGYMGSISDSQYEKYVKELGYSMYDLIGKDGIEASMESYLRGKDGIKTVLVNSGGDYIKTLSKTEPVAGKRVYLTIDKDLQKVAEEALKKGVIATRTGGVFHSKYGGIRAKQYSKCKSGAVCAVDVKTGEILAMASFPDYDPNRFAEGISSKDWNAVQSKNPRDPLAPTPLYNNATQTPVQPGSTFKPITALAALKCGLDPNRYMRDKGFIQIGNNVFGCSAWNDYRGTHGMQNLATGIQNSCNYYFYCIASGKDWTTGASLGYKEKISIKKIMDVAKEFGLGEKTGVELNETTTPLASAKRKMEAVKNSITYKLKSESRYYWKKATYENEKLLQEEIDLILTWVDENPERGELVNRLRERTGVKEDKIDKLADLLKYSYFNQAKWTIGDTFNISIGQGDNAYTPLQLANYVATLGNKGVRNSVTIVRGVESMNKEAKSSYKTKVSNSDLSQVIKGMKLVAQRGTLANCFAKFPVEVAGKTGTAQKDGKINPKDEVKYVKEHLSKIAPDIEWYQVEREIKKLMKKEPKKYPDENSAVDKALIIESNNKLNYEDINKYKANYDNFAWTVAMAPADNPKIAVVVLLVQGGISSNAAPVAREIIGSYLGVGDNNKIKNKLELRTSIN